MKYNFDEIVPRRNTNSIKWDSNTDNILPLWVADMDFRTAPAVINALEKRVIHGIFGYAKIPALYYEAIQNWFARRYDFHFDTDWILSTIGVVPAISAIIKALTEPGDKVILQSPVYNAFFSSIRNNACEVVSNDLIYENGVYRIDFDDLEEKAKDPKAKLLLLCNPHNPVGRVWTKEELMHLGEICIRYDVTIISDEIHCDFVFEPHTHIPFGSISESFLKNSITCIAPSKTFNLAGLQVANIIVADNMLREKVDQMLHVNEIASIGPFAVDALIAAYNQSEDWLESLKLYLWDNYIYLKDFFQINFPEFPVVSLEATYLVWLDCKKLGKSSKEIGKFFLENAHVRFNEGTMYGNAGEGFIRINIACPRQILEEALSQVKEALFTVS